MKLQPTPTPVITGPSSGGSVSLRPVFGTGPKGDTGDQGETGPQGEQGPAGYNATGAAEDLETLTDYVNETAGPNDFASALKASIDAVVDPQFAALPATYAHRALPTKALAKMKAGNAITFSVLGDSVLQGTTSTTPGTDDAMSLLRSTLASRFSVTVTKDNQAVGGRTAWWEMVEKWDTVIATNPDIYILGITGKNDAAYEVTTGLAKHLGVKLESSLAIIESKVRELRTTKPGADIILMSGNPYSSVYTTTNVVQQKYSRGLARIAAHYGIPYADGWGATVVAGQNYAAGGDLSDGVHPNSSGHAKLADAILALFPAAYDPITYTSTPTVALPERVYPNKHAIAIKQVTTASVTAYTDRLLTPAFMGGSWSGSGPWTTTTNNDELMMKAKCTDFAIRFTYGSGQATSVSIYVDGSSYATGIDLTGVTNAAQWFSIPDLSPGVHTIVVKKISGTSLTVERAGFTPAASEFIDIRDSRVTLSGMGSNDDTNGYWGNHSTAIANGAVITVPFIGTGLSVDAQRGAIGGGYYFSAITVDGVSAPALLGAGSVWSTFGGSGLLGHGSLDLISGLDYGPHTLVMTAQATGLKIGGFSVFDERPELRDGKCFGIAKVGETVRPPLPFTDLPVVDVTSTTANAAGSSTGTATSFLLTGTSGDVVRWRAESPKRVLY